MPQHHGHTNIRIGKHLTEVKSVLNDLDQRSVIKRIWNRDHTLWTRKTQDAVDHLGWLTVTDFIRPQIPDLITFTEKVRKDDIRQVVLLGMGGSSLGAVALCDTFGSAHGYPNLIVIDSTLPHCVQTATATIDPTKTLFLIASKSGTTIETNCLYKHFKKQAEIALGRRRSNQNFVAITDPETPLERLANDNKFRDIFLNPSHIDGRYSVLSLFGLVPAALMGTNLLKLLDSADQMRNACSSNVSAQNNPGAYLGALIASMASKNRDKLTLVASPSIEGFTLWAEQLIAESTGKDGKGIIPVVGEPLSDIEHYGDDRMFVYVRLDGDHNSHTDAAIEKLESSGQPVAQLDLQNCYDLGAEFYRWEFAAAVAGELISVHPFDQPNVQDTKDMTTQILQKHPASQMIPPGKTHSLNELLFMSQPGDYLAIMAYFHHTPELDGLLSELRSTVMRKYSIATTLGYGPRFLHSTGQLHKGGPNTGLFLQVIANHENNIPVPGESYGFGELTNVQASSDLHLLLASGRRVAVVTSDGDIPSTIRNLINHLDK